MDGISTLLQIAACNNKLLELLTGARKELVNLERRKERQHPHFCRAAGEKPWEGLYTDDLSDSLMVQLSEGLGQSHLLRKFQTWCPQFNLLPTAYVATKVK